MYSIYLVNLFSPWVTEPMTFSLISVELWEPNHILWHFSLDLDSLEKFGEHLL